MDQVTPDEIKDFFLQNKTYDDVSLILQLRFPGQRGFSVKSIKRYCKTNGISPRTSQAHVEQLVTEAVEEVVL